MKLCFVTSTIFNLGGVQRVLSVIASELSKQHEVTVLCTDDKYGIDRTLYDLSEEVSVEINSDLVSKCLLTKITRKMLKIINNYTGILNNKMFTDVLLNSYYPSEVRKKFINYFNDKNYDFVIGVEGLYSVLIGAISKNINSKTLGWQHSCYDAYFNNKYRYYWNQDIMFKSFLNKLNNYIVLTDYDKKLVDNNFNMNSCRIYNPLSFESNLKSKCDKKVILFVGRLVIYPKGIDLLLEAFKKISRVNECNDWILKIVGDGPDKEDIIKLIQKFQLEDRVIIEGFSNNIKEYYVNSSIFVSSSRWEGFGLVITEAMECGLPVIAFDNSGPREIINNSGILVRSKDVDLLSEKMKNLMLDFNKRIKLSNMSVQRAKDFSKDQILRQWNNLIYMN